MERKLKAASRVLAQTEANMNQVDSTTRNLLYSWDQVHTLPELAEIMPIRRGEMIEELRQDIIRFRGIRDSIVVWPTGGKLVVVDGHTRLEIAKELNIKFPVSFINFTNLNEAKAWVINLQTEQKRNLSPLQRAYIIGMDYELAKQDTSLNFRKHSNAEGKISPQEQSIDNQLITSTSSELHSPEGKISPQGSSQDRTSALIARIHNLKDEKTVRNYANLYEGLELIKKANKKLFDSIYHGNEPVNLGWLVSLGLAKPIIGNIETIAEIKQLLSAKEKRKASKNTLAKVGQRAFSLLAKYHEKQSIKNKKDATLAVQRLIEEAQQALIDLEKSN